MLIYKILKELLVTVADGQFLILHLNHVPFHTLDLVDRHDVGFVNAHKNVGGQYVTKTLLDV